MRLNRNKKLSIKAWPCCPKILLCGIHGFTISIYDLCLNLIRVQTETVPHTHKELAHWKNNCIRI